MKSYDVLKAEILTIQQQVVKAMTNKSVSTRTLMYPQYKDYGFLTGILNCCFFEGKKKS